MHFLLKQKRIVMDKTTLSIDIFVYGTLKIGGYFAERFDRFRISSKPATAQGVLFQADGGYPALNKGKGTIHGELHRYRDPINVLKKMDWVEGFYGEEKKDNLFTREKILVNTNDGDECEAFVYYYAFKIDKEKRIESGIWKL